jgi:hypothetical protein
VEQVWKHYLDTGQELSVGEKKDLPGKPNNSKKAKIVKESHNRYKYGARMLESIIRKVYEVHTLIRVYTTSKNLALFSAHLRPLDIFIKPLLTWKGLTPSYIFHFIRIAKQRHGRTLSRNWKVYAHSLMNKLVNIRAPRPNLFFIHQYM